MTETAQHTMTECQEYIRRHTPPAPSAERVRQLIGPATGRTLVVQRRDLVRHLAAEEAAKYVTTAS